MELDHSRVNDCIDGKDAAGLAAYLMSGTHHGKPGVPAAIKLGVVGLIHERCLEPEARVAWAERLMQRSESGARSIACALAASGWAHDRRATTRRMKMLAEDEDWEVREWAADLFGEILRLDFERALALYRGWAEEGSEELRRAVALGLSQRSKARVAREANPMLAIMATLMTRPGAYLQKNLGPFALGAGFLSRFPEQTLALCRKQARLEDENVRWNVAMAFTSAIARRKHAKAGSEILDLLASDARKRVAAAVTRARKNLRA